MILVALALAVLVRRGTVEQRDVPTPTLGKGRDIRVYLPPSYKKPEGATRRYPVVYLLHGWPGSDGNWFGHGHADESADTLIAEGKMPETILVCPDGNCGLLGRTLYMNSWDGRCRMEDYIVDDVVPWVDGSYRTIASPSARGVLGLSDGGLGAVNLALRHPSVFGACASHSANFVLSRSLGMGAVLGREPGASRLITEYSPLLTAAAHATQLRTQVIYFDCGWKDESLGENRAFHRTLDSLRVPHVYREFPGSHTWSYWRVHVQQALEVVTAHMARAGP